MGTTYGNDLTFTTLGQVPSATTQATTNKTITSSTLNGSVNPNYLSTDVSFEYGLTTSYGSTVSATQSPLSGATNTNVSVDISSLLTGTTYHFRVKAVNLLGTTYGNDLVFTTLILDFDGNIYNNVTIGTQIWMSENLKVTHYSEGTTIPNVTDKTNWNSLTTGAYCWYLNQPSTYKDPYGALYNYYTVTDNHNLCPSGWHIPTDSEWSTLVTFLGGGQIAGAKMKEAGTTHWQISNSFATNESGFTALPGGYMSGDIGCNEIGSRGFYWSSTPWDSDPTNRSWVRWLFYWDNVVMREGWGKTMGFSVRCLKD